MLSAQAPELHRPRFKSYIAIYKLYDLGKHHFSEPTLFIFLICKIGLTTVPALWFCCVCVWRGD